jgi:AcrR family transcriptional regulator
LTQRPNLLAGEKLPPPPRQARSLAKRARLKDAALAVFAKKGYEAASIEEIAGRAGVAIGGFYQHYQSKRQLLLALMDELLEGLSRLNLRPQVKGNIRTGMRELLSAAFARDLRYLGAYRAWQEAALSDGSLARKQQKIHAWTTARVRAVLELLGRLPGARPNVDIDGLAQALDSFFWSLLAQAVHLSKPGLDRQVDAATHLMYHAMFMDARDV